MPILVDKNINHTTVILGQKVTVLVTAESVSQYVKKLKEKLPTCHSVEKARNDLRMAAALYEKILPCCRIG